MQIPRLQGEAGLGLSFVASQESVAFLFPGGGAQHTRMGLGLYEQDETFRRALDRGLAAFEKRNPAAPHVTTETAIAA